MTEVKDINIEDLFADLEHPNPNINLKSFRHMQRFPENKYKNRLIQNLTSMDLNLRRKSVKALSFFGPSIVMDIVELFLSQENATSRISCLKILILMASNEGINGFEGQIKKLIDVSLNDESSQSILLTISLLRQIGKSSIKELRRLCRDENILKAKASITALIEIDDYSNKEFLLQLSKDKSLDSFIRKSALDAIGL